MIVKRAEPTPTSMCVRRPAARSRYSRSRPIAPVRAPAAARRSAICAHEMSGTTSVTIDRFPLDGGELLDARGGEIDEAVELLPAERIALGGGLDLDQAAIAAHDDIHVHLRGRILLVIEVEERFPVDDADRDRADLVRGERKRHPARRARQTDPRPVIAAVRVPPSAWMTSQSSQTVLSPRAWRS